MCPPRVLTLTKTPDHAASPMPPLVAEPSFLQSMLLALGVMLITMWLFMRIRKRKARHWAAPHPKEQVEGLRQARGLRGDLESLMVEIEQLAKRFSTQLDAKAIHLEKLVAEADERIGRLQNLSNASDRREAEAGALSARSVAEQPGTDGGAGASGQNQGPDALAASVYALADAGHDPEAISGRLGEHVGKVELILALREAT